MKGQSSSSHLIMARSKIFYIILFLKLFYVFEIF